MLGRYLDALSDEQRDRVIEAEEFANGMFLNAAGVGCLVGVAEREYFDNHVLGLNAVCPPVALSLGGGGIVGARFDNLCRKFDKDTIVRLCKARAARGNRLHEIRAEIYEELTPRSVMARREGKARRLVPEGGMNGRFPEDC